MPQSKVFRNKDPNFEESNLDMKVLVMYVNEFSYITAEKNLKEAKVVTTGTSFKDVILAFIQVEAEDEEKEVTTWEKKLVNHLKWTARKNKTSRIIL